MAVEHIKVKFENQDGEQLVANLELPLDGRPHHFALFAHCFTCNKNLNAVRNISRALALEGYGVMRFDFTGLGESAGDFADTNFSSNIEDLIYAAEFLKQHYQAPSLIIGHSLGGAAAIFAAAQIESVQAVATIGAPCDPDHVARLVEDKREEIEKHGSARVNIGGRSFTIKQQFLEDLESRTMGKVLSQLDKPILFMHDPFDKIVGIDNARNLYEKAMHPKSFLSLDGAGHLMNKEEDSLYVGKMLASWATRYLPHPDQAKLSTDKDVVTRIRKEKYVTDVKAGSHGLLADEPKEAGGKDAGPSPYDYLMGALGSCTAMTLRMYADRKKWELDEVRVHLTHEKMHAKDCEDCESKEGKIDRIAREIEIEGNLDEKQRQRLLEIANRCPVHRTLTEYEINVKSSLKE